jgi:enoyl-CoA hydratase
MLTGDTWTAEEAYRLGLVQEVTPLGEQLDRAVESAKKIAAAAPLGVRATLASARRALSGDDAAFAELGPAAVKIIQSDDAREYVKAVKEKRQPVFQGR